LPVKSDIRNQLNRNLPDLVLGLLAGLVGVWSGLWVRHILADDAMITFRVAENLAFGHGFVYNPGEYVQVTTTALYAMILAVGAWVFGSAPQAALVLNIILAALNPILAYDVGRRLAGRITGFSAALLLVIMPPLVLAFSMESYLYVFLILASMDAYTARRWRLAGVVVGFTAILRGDAVLMAVSMLTYDLLAHRRLRWQLIIPAAVIPATWYLFAIFYYGSPFPATLQAKTAQGEFNWLGDYFISGFYEYWKNWTRDNYNNPELNLLPLLYLVGLIPVFRRERTWLVIIGRDLLYIIGFELLRVTFAEWYYAPVTAGVALITGRGIQWVAEMAGRIVTGSRTRLVMTTVAAALLTGVLLQAFQPISADIVAANPDWKAMAYPPTARWIAQNTNPADTLATIDIGHLGYYSKRHIVDIVGLAQPDVAPFIAQGDFGYAIRQYNPDLVLLGTTWLPEVQNKPWFQEAYILRHNFRPQGMAEALQLFSRRSGVKVQPERPPASRTVETNVDFNRQVALKGYHFNQPLRAGDRLHLTLIWQVTAPVALDFTVFVQLVDPDNNIVAQGDGQPQQGFYPTSSWQPGEEVVDSYIIQLPEALPPGNYNLLAGFYDQNGARLQILDEAGQFSSDHVRLSGVVVLEGSSGAIH
jgi:hypothetical protein